jgi:uncharacterized membrane protein YdfJ with MMPL/SSD domain
MTFLSGIFTFTFGFYTTLSTVMALRRQDKSITGHAFISFLVGAILLLAFGSIVIPVIVAMIAGGLTGAGIVALAFLNPWSNSPLYVWINR